MLSLVSPCSLLSLALLLATLFVVLWTIKVKRVLFYIVIYGHLGIRISRKRADTSKQNNYVPIVQPGSYNWAVSRYSMSMEDLWYILLDVCEKSEVEFVDRGQKLKSEGFRHTINSVFPVEMECKYKPPTEDSCKYACRFGYLNSRR